MPSQLDLDQGGTIRQIHPIYLGPSIGYVYMPVASVLNVITGGTTTVLLGNTIVRVNFNGAVTIQLPLAKGNAAGAGAVPGSFVIPQISVYDAGGFATAHPITILPAGAELIDGLASASIVSNFGLTTLIGDTVNGGWTLAA